MPFRRYGRLLTRTAAELGGLFANGSVRGKPRVPTRIVCVTLCVCVCVCVCVYSPR